MSLLYNMFFFKATVCCESMQDKPKSRSRPKCLVFIWRLIHCNIHMEGRSIQGASCERVLSSVNVYTALPKLPGLMWSCLRLHPASSPSRDRGIPVTSDEEGPRMRGPGWLLWWTVQDKTLTLGDLMSLTIYLQFHRQAAHLSLTWGYN